MRVSLSRTALVFHERAARFGYMVGDLMAKRSQRPTAVGDVLAAILSNAEGSRETRTREGALTVRIYRAFDALGPAITDHADLVQVRGGTLTLVVDDPTWLTELGFLRPEIMDRMNRALPRPIVTEIRMRHGRRAPRKKPPPALPAKLTPRELEVVEGLGAQIRDPETRDAVMRAAKRALSAKRTPAPPRK